MRKFFPAETIPFHCAMVVIAGTTIAIGAYPVIALPVAGSAFMIWIVRMLDA